MVSTIVFMEPSRRRSGNDSRCCDPNLAPLNWIDCQDASHPSVVALSTWLATLVPFARIVEESEIEELFAAAANGELWDSGDETTPIKPIKEDPEVYELRRTALSKKLRFYHGEPAELPAKLVALHRHIKVNNPSQQDEIEYAAKRYIAGRASGWA